MIIDTHVHTFPDKVAAGAIKKLAASSHSVPYTDGTLSGLKRSMEEHGVDVAIVLPVATSKSQAESINRFAAKTNESFEETGIMSLAGIHPDNDNYKEILKEAKSMGLSGIKLHPDYQLVDFDDIRYLRIIDFAAELGLVIVTHAGVDVGLEPVNKKTFCTPDMAARVLDRIDYGRIVFAHMGGWRMWDEVLEKLAGRDCFFDTAFCFEEQPGIERISDELFKKIVRKHGAEKILFATDSPWGCPGDMAKRIRETGITADEQRLIFSENAARLFGIKRADF